MLAPSVKCETYCGTGLANPRSPLGANTLEGS